MSDDEWEWIALVDPASVERERFNVKARTLRRQEGTHLGELHDSTPTVDVRIIQALTREREREDREQHRVEVRGELRGRIRSLENQLARERREHARKLDWQKKLSTLGHRFGGPSSLETP